VELEVAELVLVFELLDEFDGVVELEDVTEEVVEDVGGRLELEEELDNVINPNTLIAITRTNPIRNHNQKGFLLFLSLSSSSSSL
jgi:Mg2+/Co2+ transporter CorB